MELCETNYQYVTPQAALNSQGKSNLKLNGITKCIRLKPFHFAGNWMFVVNQVDTARQLVRTETCA